MIAIAAILVGGIIAILCIALAYDVYTREFGGDDTARRIRNLRRARAKCEANRLQYMAQGNRGYAHGFADSVTELGKEIAALEQRQKAQP